MFLWECQMCYGCQCNSNSRAGGVALGNSLTSHFGTSAVSPPGQGMAALPVVRVPAQALCLLRGRWCGDACQVNPPPPPPTSESDTSESSRSFTQYQLLNRKKNTASSEAQNYLDVSSSSLSFQFMLKLVTSFKCTKAFMHVKATVLPLTALCMCVYACLLSQIANSIVTWFSFATWRHFPTHNGW